MSQLRDPRGPSGRGGGVALRLSALGLLLCGLSWACLGCTPRIPEGVFACTYGSEDECPRGWQCLPDGRCYDAAFEGLPLYHPCDEDVHCASGMCLRAFDANAALGQCSEDCTLSCPDVFDPETLEDRDGVCAPGQGCLGACSDDEDCGESEVCVVVPGGAGDKACVAFTNLAFAGNETCGIGDPCTAGLACLSVPSDPVGICAWPCAASTSCPPGSTCERLPMGIANFGDNPSYACLATCTLPAGDCGDPALICLNLPPPGLHCVPAGWEMP